MQKFILCKPTLSAVVAILIELSGDSSIDNVVDKIHWEFEHPRLIVANFGIQPYNTVLYPTNYIRILNRQKFMTKEPFPELFWPELLQEVSNYTLSLAVWFYDRMAAFLYGCMALNLSS